MKKMLSALALTAGLVACGTKTPPPPPEPTPEPTMQPVPTEVPTEIAVPGPTARPTPDPCTVAPHGPTCVTPKAK